MRSSPLRLKVWDGSPTRRPGEFTSTNETPSTCSESGDRVFTSISSDCPNTTIITRRQSGATYIRLEMRLVSAHSARSTGVKLLRFQMLPIEHGESYLTDLCDRL